MSIVTVPSGRATPAFATGTSVPDERPEPAENARIHSRYENAGVGTRICGTLGPDAGRAELALELVPHTRRAEVLRASRSDEHHLAQAIHEHARHGDCRNGGLERFD